MQTPSNDGPKAVGLSQFLMSTAEVLEPDHAIRTAAFVNALGMITASLTVTAPNGDGKTTPLAKVIETLTAVHDHSVAHFREELAREPV